MAQKKIVKKETPNRKAVEEGLAKAQKNFDKAKRELIKYKKLLNKINQQ